LEPERGPSSPSQSSLWLLALLGTLLFAFLPSKHNQFREPVHPQDSADNKDTDAQVTTTAIPKIVPTPRNSGGTNQPKERTPFWEKLAVLIALGLLVVNVCQLSLFRRQLESTIAAVLLTERNFNFDDGRRLSIILHNKGHAIGSGIDAMLEVTIRDLRNKTVLRTLPAWTFHIPNIGI
jgi:hypothetical protein